MDKNGLGNTDKIFPALEKVIDLNANGIPCENNDDYLDILILSFGVIGNPDDPISKSIDNIALCTIPVISAGNSGHGGDNSCRNNGDRNENSICSPGTARKAITVAATYKNDVIADFSSRGPVKWIDEKGIEQEIQKPDIVAPGNFICSAIPKSLSQNYFLYSCIDNKHAALSGSSQATPIVAGAIALLKQKYPDLDSDGVKKILRESSIDIGEQINVQGYGRIDIGKASGIRTRPQSKIVNYNTIPINGNLIIKIQKYENNKYIDEKEIFNEEISLPARGILKLDNGEDSKGNKIFSGFNNLVVSLVNEGNYRVYASFEENRKKKEAKWEFKVSGDNFECKDSDNGKIYNIKGSATKGNIQIDDSCENSRNIIESFCDNNELKSIIHACPILTKCINGECVPIELFNDNKDNDYDDKIDCNDDCFTNKLCKQIPVQAIERNEIVISDCKTNLSEFTEIRELQSANINDLYIELLGAGLKKDNVVITLGKEVINLNSINKSIIKTVSDKNYKIELISFSENSAIINVSKCD